MKSSSFRTLVDVDGKQYIFDSSAFSNIVTDRCGLRKVGEFTKRLTTQTAVMMNIADNVGVTFDAVKHWKQGDNGPGDIEIVKSMASCLNVNYKKLLIPLFNTSEDTNIMNKNELNIISSIYGECISIVYDFNDFWFVEENKINSIGKDESFEKRNELKELEMINRINRLHLMVDKSSLMIREEIRYKLHRILIEYQESFFNYLPSRWEELQIYKREDDAVWMRVSSLLLHYLYAYDSREEAISGMFSQYIDEEISLAEKLGYYNNNRIPDEIRKKYEEVYGFSEGLLSKDEIRELCKYGFKNTNRDAAFELSPNIITIDLMIQVISTVFKNDFPELSI